MDHKRGYNLLDQADHEARKRQKDLSHPSSTPLFRTLAEISPRTNHNNRGNNNNNNNLWVPGATKPEANHPMKTADEVEQTVEESSYKRMLPLLRKQLEHEREIKLADSRRGVKRWSTFEKDDKTCALCPPTITFKGIDALLIHAEKYNKDRPQQHRGYFRALKDALKEHEELQREPLEAKQLQREHLEAPQQKQQPQACNIRPALGYQKGKGGRPDTAQNTTAGGVEARLDWKPNILIVDNNKLSEVECIICPEQEHRIASDGRHACVPKDKLKRPRLKEVLAVYSTGDSDHDKRNVFVFPATEVGYIHDKVLKDTCRLEHRGHHKELGFHCDDHRELINNLQGGHSQDQGDMLALTLKRLGEVKNLSGLKLLPEEELVYDQQLFDNSKFDKITKIVKRWSNNFKAVDRKFEVQRSFHEDDKMHEVAEVWQEDLRRINGYQPAIKKKVKEQMVVIEDKLRSEHLMWLQEVEAVREQFQRMAHSIKKEEEAANLRNTRWEQQNMKRQEEKEHERIRRNNLELMKRTHYYSSIKKYKRSTEGRLLMETWSEEYDKLKWESCKAKEERVRLQNIHEKVHQKALESKKGKCPICFEQLRRDFAKDSNEPFSKFYPVSKLCLNLTCPRRH